MPPEPSLEAALAVLRSQPDVRYAEARLVDETSERLAVRDGRPEQVTTETSRGVGIRVLGSKTWGFACTADTSEAALVAAARRALEVAGHQKASGREGRKRILLRAARLEIGGEEFG